MKSFIPVGMTACCCFGMSIAITLMLSLNYKTLFDNAASYTEA